MKISEVNVAYANTNRPAPAEILPDYDDDDFAKPLSQPTQNKAWVSNNRYHLLLRICSGFARSLSEIIPGNQSVVADLFAKNLVEKVGKDRARAFIVVVLRTIEKH